MTANETLVVVQARRDEVARRLEQMAEELPELQELLGTAGPAARSLSLVWESSEYVARCCERSPQLLRQLLAGDLQRAAVDFPTELESLAAKATEAQWMELISAASMGGLGAAVGSAECTPGYYNNEGHPEGGGFASNITKGHPGGPIAFFQHLRDWAAADFDGLAVS